MSTQPADSLRLCSLDELPDPGSRGFDIDGIKLFAVCHQGQVRLYLNRCPHRGIPLEWQTDSFLDSSGQLIQCATHGALFLPESGECIAGPCSGQSLQSLHHEVHDNALWWRRN